MTNAYGFRIVGGCQNERRLVDWLAAFAGYAACDERAQVEREAYLSAFAFGDDFAKRNDGWRVDVKGYNGLCGSWWLWFDIDATELAGAHQHAKRLAAGVVERYSIDGDDLLIFFSGAKGFHIGLPLSLCGSPGASIDFNQVCRALAESLAASLQVTIDAGIFDKVRAFRAPNSRHPKTGLHKRRIEFDELLQLSTDAIVRLAATPEPFDIPSAPAAKPQAVADWQAAVAIVAERGQAVAVRRSTGDAKLNRSTLDFIREGATTGDRHRRLFSAAANLAEFGCPNELAIALLTEAGLDSGLSPSEVRRQILCGLDHANTNAPAAPCDAQTADKV